VHARFWWETLRGRDHLEDPSIDERMTVKWIFRKLDGVMDWNDLAQKRDGWRALVNAVIKLQVP
jgi:hypothetical protein